MAALLFNIQPGDEVIMPSYTFVSTANAFLLRGAVLRFVDSRPDHPGMDENKVLELINNRTRAIVPVHYAGIACDMDVLLDLAKKNNLFIAEDAAQAIDSFYKGKPLGSFGDLSAFSFHETKNIISGEGGMLVINNPSMEERAEILWEKGTNRGAFFRGEVDKYNWVDIGSSFLPSDIIAAFLFAQLENLRMIQNRRLEIWKQYDELLRPLSEQGHFRVASIPDYATNNAHIYYLVCNHAADRESLIAHLKSKNIHTVFHYLSLHKSPFYKDRHDGREMPWADHYTECLVRLPLYYDLTPADIDRIGVEITQWSKEKSKKSTVGNN
jgi:dTDP-4-amino-4,6-dideoxygalactose transaminase